ncbi:AMP-binding enzyme, C-terminal domain [Dillenia turbinata]|uniref:AMP-binding enzyme, C-terminal domain n=1 Tax=Dillenia turbinata TaxID=194707 RepID=A0AAN8VJZ2_9MAGN
MAEELSIATISSIDPNSGYCSNTKVYHSLRPSAPLPPDPAFLSLSDYIFSQLEKNPSLKTAIALIEAATGNSVSYPEFIQRVKNLARYLQNKVGLSKGDVAFILSPNSIHIPILYFSLFHLGVVISPANPMNTTLEISRQVELSKPVIAFATSAICQKLPRLFYPTILLDSHEFFLMMTTPMSTNSLKITKIGQSELSVILYSSGTTGKCKGVEITSRTWTAMTSAAMKVSRSNNKQVVGLCVVPYFHSFGFGCCVKAVATMETMVVMERFDLRLMMRTIEKFNVTNIAVAPPVVVAMTRSERGVGGYDLSSLKVVSSGGAAIQKVALDKFVKLFPGVQLSQSYGMTELGCAVAQTISPNESKMLGSVGRLAPNCRAKIIDPDSGVCLPPLQQGELWIKSPTIMKGYVDDEEATAATLNSEGWLRTGDLFYIDNNGFLFFVERIKELIKYKGYQVPPAELEHLLHSHPEIDSAAVIPYPDEEAGQIPVAFVVRRPCGNIQESQIRDFIAKQVAPYKRIRRVYFVDSIPRNATGKTLRKDLIRLAVSGHTSKL